jgi:hypothetical protein
MKYFLHDSSSFDDEKITQVFMEFGFEGLGLFYTILEKIAKQEKPINTNVLKKQLFVGKKLNKCWNFLESIELIYSNNGETFNENLLKFSEKYQVSREKNKERIEKFRIQKAEKQADTKNVTHSETVTERSCNAPKVKISKVKINKDNNMSVAERFPPHSKVSLSDEYKKIKTEARALAIDFWLKEFRPGWVFEGMHGKCINEILKKIEKVMHDGGKEVTAGNIVNTFKYICCNLSPFYQDKDLNTINSHFNTIVTEIKNRNNGKPTTTEKQSIFRRH